MSMKVIGALLIVFSCGFFGFAMAANLKREESALLQMIAALDYMECELQYRQTALPELCRQTAGRANGLAGKVFGALAKELECQISPNAESCIRAALASFPDLPRYMTEAFGVMGDCLGTFDLEGQIKCLESTRAFCRRELDTLCENRENRLRSYKTLGLCAGAALAILLI